MLDKQLLNRVFTQIFSLRAFATAIGAIIGTRIARCFLDNTAAWTMSSFTYELRVAVIAVFISIGLADFKKAKADKVQHMGSPRQSP